MPTPFENLDRIFVAGEWREGSGKRLVNTNPFSGDTIFEMGAATETDVDEACKAARKAQADWAALPPSARSARLSALADGLEARREEVMGWITREIGGTQVKAALEVQLVLGVLREAAVLPFMVEGRILPEDIPGKESRAYRQPVGVIALISPWNFPLQLTARTLAPALAVGNAVVLKPASDSIVTGGTIFARLLEEAGFPKGLVSVLPGGGSDIGTALIEHEIPRLVSFTGSTPVGRGIAETVAKSAILKPLELELGGNGPIVVLDDADIDAAVNAAVWGKFMHAGQICMAINRIIVDDSVFDAFVEKFVARTKELKVGDPSKPDTFVGPLVNKDQADGVMELIEKAKGEGADCRLGGERDGLVIPPHVFVDVGEDSCLCTNEIFGPVAPIVRAKDEADALRLANKTEYGLSSAVFSGDIERGVAFAKQVDAGMTHVNDQPVNDSPFSPFGGEKNSGIGRFNGRWAVEAFTTDHWITVQREPRQYPFSLADLG